MISGSCNKENAPDCFQKSGDRITISRTFDQSISKIFLDDYVHVELMPSEENYCEIEGPKNLLPEIITELNSGELNIRNENTCGFVRNLNPNFIVRVFANPNEIEIVGTGDLAFLDTLHVDDFKLDCYDCSGNLNLLLHTDKTEAFVHEGVASLTIKGTTFRSDLFNQGINVLDASEFDSRFQGLISNSINTIYGRSSEYLYVSLNESGDVVYYGSPNTIDIEGDGSGELLFGGE